MEVSLDADATIRSVETQGVRSLEIRGTHARLVVAKWAGTLSVDATLENGKKVHASIDASGPHAARLAPVASVKPSAKPTVVRPTVTTQPELQSNPYGNP